jgi:phage-related holin
MYEIELIMERYQAMLTKLITDVKSYIALGLALVESFYGTTYPLIGSLFILGLIDVAVGYFKNRKLKKEKFNPTKIWGKFNQGTTFLVAVTAAVLSDHFFQHYGMRAFWVAETVCSAFGIYQFLHIIENLGHLGFPIVDTLKAMLKKRMGQEKNNDQNIQE